MCERKVLQTLTVVIIKQAAPSRKTINQLHSPPDASLSMNVIHAHFLYFHTQTDTQHGLYNLVDTVGSDQHFLLNWGMVAYQTDCESDTRIAFFFAQ